MKKALFLPLISLFLVGCAGVNDPHFNHYSKIDKSNFPKSHKLMVRLTTYSKNERKNDRWTRRGQSSTGLKLQDKISLAADPRDIPYFSKVKLPCFDHLLTVVDTGSALKSRTAAIKYGLNVPVLDLFFSRESEAKKFRRENPMFMDVLVYTN